MREPTSFDYLEVDDAQPFHILAVPKEVTPEEVEALVKSLWDVPGWEASGKLRLTAEAYITGPWRLRPATITTLNLPLWTAYGYLVSVPALRTANPMPDELVGRDPLMDAFPDGTPTGVELEVLDNLRKIARRLAGLLRVSTGVVIVPDPDSAVNLRVLSPVWLDPAACLAVVQRAFPEARSLLDSVPPTGPKPRRGARPTPRAETPEERMEFDRAGLREAAIAGMDPGERAWLHAEAEAFDQAALEMPQILDSYAIGVEAGQYSQVHVVVFGETAIPLAVGSAPDGLICYDIRWMPRDLAMAQHPKLPRSQRLERLAAIDVIEKIARVIHQEVGGFALDQDNFLITL